MSVPHRLSGMMPCALALALLACGPTAPTGTDADVDGGDGDVETEAEPPVLPELTPCPDGWVEVPPDPEDPHGFATCDPWPGQDPVTLPDLGPCPTGWRAVPPEEPDGVTTCDPWPEAGREECEAVDEAHFPGEQHCARVGTACRSGDWADDLPAGARVLYVRAGEAAGGDGTRELPFGMIADAMDAATPGTIIALSKGTFDEAVELDGGVTLWGACVAETLVACSTSSPSDATVTARGMDTAVRNLRIGGERVGVSLDGRMTSISIQDVVIASTMSAAVTVSNGSATLESVVVRDTRSRAGELVFGRGMQLEYGAEVDVTRAAFERNREFGIVAFDPGTELILTDVVIADTESQELDRSNGRGLGLDGGASVVVTRGVFERNRGAGITARSGETRVSLTDVVIRDTRSQERDLTEGRGLEAAGGAAIVVERALIERNRGFGVVEDEAGTSVLMTDVVIRDTRFQERDRLGGIGLLLDNGSECELSRVLIERNQEAGVSAMHGGKLQMTDAVIRDTRGRDLDKTLGRGLDAEYGATVVVANALFERNAHAAILAFDEGTTLSVTDAVLRGTLPQASDDTGGIGLALASGAKADAVRVLIERNAQAGAVSIDGGLSLTDVVIRDTEVQASDQQFGWGLCAQEASTVEVTRALIERNREVGVVAMDEETSIRLTDAVVRETRTSERGDAGTGVVTLCGASLAMSRFELRGNALCGCQLAHGSSLVDGVPGACERGGAMDLSNGEISDNEVCGINVQTTHFEVRRLLDHVIFGFNNGNNLDQGTSIYVPEAEVPDLDPGDK
jgi:hypothetical protein